MRGWFRDARYATRQLQKTPLFTLIAILTLALGIGANSTIFSWISSTLFSPLPGAHPQGTPIAIERGVNRISYPDFLDLRAHSKTLSALIGWNIEPVDLTSAGKPQPLWASLTTANYFSALGIRPVLGRFFEPQEEDRPGGAPVAVLSYRTWQLLFDGDSSILGRTVYLNRHPFTVIGVAPPLFQGATAGLRMDLWTPLMMSQQLTGWDNLHNRSAYWLQAIGILAHGATRVQAQQELTAEMAQIARAFPQSHRGSNAITTFALWRAPQSANQYLSVVLPPLMAIALVVLLLACVNVASLFLVRAVTRRREMAVRLSLGASRVRLVRQLLVESVLVALAGGGLALFVTFWSAGEFGRFLPPTDVAVDLHMHVDGRVLALTFLLSTLTGIAFGILPALRSSRIVPVAVLKEEAGTSSGSMHKARLTSALVIAQIALSFLLLVCGGLFIRSFRKEQRANPGFQADHVLLSSVDLFSAGYTGKAGLALQRALLQRIQNIPGVQSATLSSWSPLGFHNSDAIFTPEGYAPRHNESLDMLENQVGPDYLKTLGIRPLAGRDFNAEDTPGTRRVAIVNQAFVQRYWPGQNALGRRIEAFGEWYTVVGVAANSKYVRLSEAPRPIVYRAALQEYNGNIVLDVLVNGDPKAYAASVTAAVHSLDPELPVLNQYPLSRAIQIASTGTRIAGTFVGLFGLIGLALAAIGLYGVIAYTTRQRLHELGIRIALGATRRGVFDLVLRHGLRITAIGIASGLLCSLLLTPLLRGQFYDVAPYDPLTYLCVGAALCVVALAACSLPAQRAAQVDPNRALRYE